MLGSASLTCTISCDASEVYDGPEAGALRKAEWLAQGTELWEAEHRLGWSRRTVIGTFKLPVKPLSMLVEAGWAHVTPALGPAL